MSLIIKLIQETIYYLRVQNYHEGCMRFRVILQKMQEEKTLKENLCELNSELYFAVAQLLEALENNDMVLLADLLEEVLLPSVKSMIIPIEPVLGERYSVEITSSGYMTVRDLESGLYLHSNSNPMEEARLLIQLCYSPEKERYAVWGAGLGYHIAQLYEEARKSIEIVVFDEDDEIINLAKNSEVLRAIPGDRIRFIVDKTGIEFADCITKENMGILLHFPSIKKIRKTSLRELMNQFFASWNGTMQLKNELKVNFRKNHVLCKKNVDNLQEMFRDKEVIIVGAGPSLDDTLKFLKENHNGKVVVAATTVWKKLMNASIAPDFLIVMDSQSRTLGHINNLEDTKLPLIVDSTAYWEFAERCEGEKFIVYQKGYDEADKWAQIEGYSQYETGGSVITLALEIALKLGAKSIYLVGVDLAYPAGKSHTEGVMDQQKRNVDDMKKIESVTGEMVCVDSLFDSYRKWIENKIHEYPHVKCYNLSTCGAKIKGTVSYWL